MRFGRGLPKVLAVVAMAVLALTVSLETPTAHGLGPITSQGVDAHAAQAWHDAGFNGAGVKVGIIDGGFQGLSSQLGREFPATVTARCYTSLGMFTSTLADCENGIDHGTISAESVMDLAPGASLYLSNPISYLDTRNAVDWMVGQGVSVIYYSSIDQFEGPGDGSTPFRYGILNTVDAAVAGGAAWVNPAGNYGQKTWFGSPRWSEFGFLQFQGIDVFNTMDLLAGDKVVLELRWEDSWQAARRDLELIIWDEVAETIVAFNFDLQQGAPGQVPHEVVQFQAPRDGQYSAVVSFPEGIVAPEPAWVQLLVSGPIGPIKYHTGFYSISNPADSANPGLLAVGASHWSTPYVIEPFSSRGPTPDQRTKPDVVGTNCAVTSRTPLDSYGDGFCGTSQAAAHVAGMAALVRQRFPAYSPIQVADYLKHYGEQQENPDPNNNWGHGFALLPATETDCATGGAVTNAADNPGLVSDCEVLLADRDTLAGPGMLDWSDSTPIADWDGVTLGGTPQRVTDLYLTNKGLTGTIPAALGNLAKLESLDLGVNYTCDSDGCRPEPPSVNQLTGSIPPELGSLANLTWLDLDGNQLTGSIPPELGSLANLTWLDLDGNQLTGSIPPELGSLANLTWLDLDGNQLTGSIPPELGSLANLQDLYLASNQLTGSIPPELGSLVNLEWLSLRDNQLSGEIPAELDNLTNLESLYLAFNQLTGCIPAALRDVPNNDIDQLSLDFCAGAPGAPTGLTAVAQGPTQMELSWTAPGDDGGAPITGYRIESSVDGNDPWVEVFTTTGGGTSYTDDGTDSNGPMFEVGTTRYYRVAAINSAGTGPFSDPRHAGGDPLVAQYDANGNGMIERGEVIKAIRDYLGGGGGITRSEVIQLIRLYLAG